MSRILVWFLPGGFILAAAWAVILGLGSPAVRDTVATAYPWVIYPAALVMGVFFHRSRVVAGILALATVAWAGVSGFGGYTAFYLLGGLAALVLGAAAPMKDRGVLTVGGILLLGGIVVVELFMGLLLAVAPEDMAVFLSAMPLPASFSLWSGLPQPVFVIFLLVLPGALVAALIRGGPVDRGLVWALVLLLLAMVFAQEPGAASILLMGGALTLGLSVVETSYAMAYRDDLTGLPARRALNAELEGLGGVYTVAMVDVDHFKKFNDRYGHDVGDQVLRMVAGRLARTPGGGKAFRYGGEEFTLLFPGKARQEVTPLLETLREDVARAVFTLRSWRRPRKRPVNPGAWKTPAPRESRELSVTVSIGVADSSGKDAVPETVLKKADEALYRAKKGGRNRVAH